MKNKKTMTLAQKINILRAAVMGANDGILSVAGIVLGVAGASTSNFAIFISGIAGMLAGTVSMAMGEYVSVNAEKDSQKQAIENEKLALKDNYDGEVDYVRQKYLKKGIKPTLVEKAVTEMMNENALKTMVRERYGFNLGEFTSPYAAAIVSMISFPLGSILPLCSISFFPRSIKVVGTFIAVIFALAVTGFSAARLSHANKLHGTVRNVISGVITMLVTYGIGSLFGH
ncbi:VIT1/CCC1 transporter family protein [Ligilactobacillus cholophilus]|uniref:VIT1/CCC1 transporter family protein n=1 Tax=Ligilactobacillus cholophilus TaxID=3050131 RepID=UPI0025AFA452|nr:VIT family protein [Ligilactobacillus cholophilus]